MIASLLAVAVIMTLVFLILVRLTITRQIKNDLANDVQRSMLTFRDLQSQRRQMLARTAGLIADLPSLKALMTAPDATTIIDGGAEFWRVSGSSILILSDQNGRMLSFYNSGLTLDPEDVRAQSAVAVQQNGTPSLLLSRGRMFEVLSQAIQFGSAHGGFHLGYVTVGYELDQAMAHEVQQTADAQIAFMNGNTVVATTLQPRLAAAIVPLEQSTTTPIRSVLWTLDGERFLVQSMALDEQPHTQPSPALLVLKSYDKAARALHTLNLGIAVIALLGLLTGVFLAISIAETITAPIVSLLVGTRTLGGGDFNYQWRETGAREVRELSRAFREMQLKVQRTQQDLLRAERMATIGHMASSVSHDLRHYLTSIYANAEFLCTPGLPSAEQEAMLAEVRAAVFGMTDLLDSLLLFGRTSLPLHIRHDSLSAILERIVTRIRMHPDARTVEIVTAIPDEIDADFDPQELGRAVYNLLLNACHAARRGPEAQQVTLRVVRQAQTDIIDITLEDTGPGVPESIRSTLFEPFVSEGKESGTGLGLALALRIAQAHAGTLELVSTQMGRTIFRIRIPASQAVGLTVDAEQLRSEAAV